MASALKLVFAPARSAEPIDPAAYDMFLKARALLLDGHPDRESRGKRARSILEGVVAAAPSFANAWASLAAARGELALLAMKFRGQAAAGEAAAHRAAAGEAGKAALDLDPGQGSVYAVLSATDYGALRDQIGVPTCVLERQSTVNVKLKAVLGREPLPEVLLITNRCP